MQIYLRKYGTSGTIDFSLYSYTGSEILTSAVFTSGCCIVGKEGGTSALSVNLPRISPNNFSLDLTADELSTKRLFVKFVDSQWLAHSYCIETYGVSGSQHADIASGLLASLIDTVPLQQIFTELLAGISGYIVKTNDTYAYLNRDNLTTAFTMSAGDGMRTRV